MATSGSITGTAKAGSSVASNYTFWAEWNRTGYSIENNTSTITVSLIIQKTSGNSNGAYNLNTKPTVLLSVNGSAKTITNDNLDHIDTRNYARCVFATWTGTVTHNADGSLSCPIVASFEHYGSDSLDSGSLSGNAVLDTIPRASTPTVSASSVQMGSAVTITTNRKASSFTHTLTYSFGGSTGTIATGVGASYAWTVPDLASKVNNATSGTCTITCQTYSGSTLVGSKTVTITLTVPARTAPTVSASSVGMGASVTIYTSRASSNFTHTLSYSFAGATGTIATGVGTSQAWTVPDLASRISGKTSDTCTITCQTYNGTALVGTATVTLTLTVPAKTTPTVSASSVAMGSSVTITTNRNSANFTHTLTYSFGGATGTIATGVATSQAWNVPDMSSNITGSTSGTCTITCQTYNGSALVGSATVTLTLNVPDKSTPTTSSDTVKMGASVTITTNRKSSAFTHTLTYSFGGSTGTIATNVGASYEWTVPDLSSKISGASSGTCTITCQTYNGTALVGSATKTITLTVLSISTPTVSAATVKMGQSVTIYTNRNSTAYTHTISYTIGSKTETLATTASTSVTWTPSKDLAAYTGNKTSAHCTITCDTYNGSALLGSATVTITLTVPDATVPNLEASSVVLGENLTIRLPIETEAYTHEVKYSVGDYSETIATGYVTNVFWVVPMSIASHIPNATSATVTITCITKFKDSDVVVGTNSKTFTATVPKNSDTIPDVVMTVRCVHDLPSKFDGIYIEGKSKVEVSYEVKSNYAEIASYRTTVGAGQGDTNPYLSPVLTTAGVFAIKGTITDTRGFSTTTSKNISVVSYSRPRIVPADGENKIICERCNAEGNPDANGTYLLLKVGRKYSNVNWKNTSKLSYRYKTNAAGESEYSEPITLLATDAGADYVSEVIPDIVPNPAIAYTIQIIAEDDIGEGDIVTIPIPTSFITAHAPEGGHGFTLGGYHDPQKVDYFDCWFHAHFHGDILIGENGMTLKDYILSVISEGG